MGCDYMERWSPEPNTEADWSASTARMGMEAPNRPEILGIGYAIQHNIHFAMMTMVLTISNNSTFYGRWYEDFVELYFKLLTLLGGAEVVAGAVHYGGHHVHGDVEHAEGPGRVLVGEGVVYTRGRDVGHCASR